ncbi:endonuclease/exonuclease/phosphatase family protein [Microlunatus parietis]|uniref:endonuclease/exonuclease/phosphatase family protein n=1 Tax=Microlunatus parietis TaxID=682979 RepID=UPI001FE24F08|nr:endonuclease/exonuclease/phosphatase family protein [Microlunatus parietis]
MRPPTGVWSRRLPLIVDTLRRAEFDLVGLQEISDESRGEDPVVETLADALGVNLARTPDGQLALLTPHRIRSSTVVPLTVGVARDEAVAGYGSASILHAVIAAPGGDTNFLVAHWTPRSASARIDAAQALIAYLSGLPYERLVVVGDLNTVAPEKPELALLGQGERQLVDAWAAVHPGHPGPTMPSHDPAVRLDYVFLSPDLRPVSTRRIGDRPDQDGFYPSDHLGVVATATALE